MQDSKHFLAVDLGATSGRTILGTVTNGKIETEELTRFANTLIETGHHLYWDIFALYQEIVKALKAVSRRRITIESIGIDTWGVDFVCFGEDGEPLRNPIAYRDPYTTGMADRYFKEVMDRETVYQKTGTQIMDINSLYQLYAQRQEQNTALAAAWKILFTPDALAFMLTGKAVCEQTIASSSQMLNPSTGDLDDALLATVGLRREQFGAAVAPGTVIGTLTEKLQHLTGLGPVPVIAVAGHDTASAIAAIPAKDERFAYLSSGTWSLRGIETTAPSVKAGPTGAVASTVSPSVTGRFSPAFAVSRPSTSTCFMSSAAAHKTTCSTRLRPTVAASPCWPVPQSVRPTETSYSRPGRAAW